MKQRRLGTLIAACSLAVVATGLALTASDREPAGAASAALTPSSGTRSHRFVGVSWADRPQSVKEISERSAAVVEAEVTSIAVGPSLGPPPGTPDPEAATIPTQRISFKSLDVLDGAIAGEFVLFKTGSGVTSLEGDPPYDLGERYVLFVEPRIGPGRDGEPDGTYVPVGPDGRLRESRERRVEKVIDGPVGRALSGKTKDEVRDEVKRSKRKDG